MRDSFEIPVKNVDQNKVQLLELPQETPDKEIEEVNKQLDEIEVV